MTDDTEIYRKMCATANLPWEPKIRDCFTVNQSIGIWGKDSIYVVDEYTLSVKLKEKAFSDIVVPHFSIKQLMEMLPKEENNLHWHKEGFCTFTFADGVHFSGDTPEQALIRGVKWERDGKKWNGEDDWM